MPDDREAPGATRARRNAQSKWVLLGLAALLPAVLFAAHPLLSLFEQNQTELPLSVIWSPLAVTTAAIAALYGVLLLIFRRWDKAGALAALAVLAFFYFDTFKKDIDGLHLSGGWALVLWLGLCSAVTVLIVRTHRNLGTLMVGLGVAAAVLAVVPATRIASYQHRHPAVEASNPRLWATALPPPAQATTKPDIYVIIPDDYARADVLRKYFHYDNHAFADQLRRRGFTISEQARTPYSDSESNITAELNLDYLTGLGRVLGSKSQDVRPLKTLMEDSRASRLAKSLGYRYVHLDSDEVTFAAGNPDTSPVGTPDSFPSLWLQKSVLREVGGPFGFTDKAAYERFRKAVRSSFSRLDAVPRDRGRPNFVVFHTLIPHDPYVFGARGQSVTFPSTADDVIHSRLGMKYYLPQLEYVERKLLQSVDTIRARSKQPPVIVIQADEGFEAGSTFDEATSADIRVKGLVAFSIPGVKAKAPQPPITMNTLRYVFNQVWGTHYPMLPAASYAEADYPYQWEEPLRVR